MSPKAGSSHPGWLPNSNIQSSVITDAVSSNQDAIGTFRLRDATTPAKKIGSTICTVKELDWAFKFVDDR